MTEVVSHSNTGGELKGEILVVEDEQIVRYALTWLLSASGYTPLSFATAEEALRELEHQPVPNIALVDVDLPGMSGLELIAKLAQNRPAFRAVLVTAVEGERINSFRRAHSVGYLRKPVDFSALLDVLAREADSGHAPDQKMS